MIRVATLALSPSTTVKLNNWQLYIDSAPTYVEKVIRARAQFALSNRIGNSAFTEIKAKLSDMCSGARRCMYCEDSVADEVEHHRPKAIYPEHTFWWSNLLYACGPCNGPKNNRFAIFGEGEVISVGRKNSDPIVPPRSGPFVLIDPRSEDPMHFILLDLIGQTFRFTPHPLADTVGTARAEYTIDLLGLNKKDFLLAARKEAFHSYSARLNNYVYAKRDNVPEAILNAQRDAIVRMQHPTVFREMLRQAPFLESVTKLLSEAPEISAW